MPTLPDIERAIAEAHARKEYRPVAVALISDSAGRILLVQSAKNHDWWGFPQGGIDNGEKVAAALMREIEEEVGISPQQLCLKRFLHQEDLDAESTRVDKRGFSKGKRYFFFALSYSGDEHLRCDPKEITAYQWVSPLQIPEKIEATRAEKRSLALTVLSVYLEKK